MDLYEFNTNCNSLQFQSQSVRPAELLSNTCPVQQQWMAKQHISFPFDKTIQFLQDTEELRLGTNFNNLN